MVQTAPPTAERALVPRHVAVIMDGNGRWAEAHGRRRSDGHRAGTENIREVIESFGRRGVGYLTLFAFSTENWKRPRREVRALMRILARAIDREVQPLHEAGVQLRYIGRLDVLEPALQRKIEDAVELTRHNDAMTVCVAFNYGGRAELVDAVRRIIADGLPEAEIDEGTIGRYLYTSDLPDPDLIVRTGGDQRISNFLIWQAAYAEYYFSPVYWPDFDATAIDSALDSFAERVRNFGAPRAGGANRASPDVPRNGNGR